MPADTLQQLADAIAAGLTTKSDQMGLAMKGIFSTRFHSRSATDLKHEKPPFIRNAYGEGSETEHVAYAGFIRSVARAHDPI